MGIKSSMKKTFWGEYAISVYHSVLCRIVPKLVSDETATKRYYKKQFGKELNLDDPQTFAEKLNWYKLYARDPLMVKCADKVAVRDFIIEKGYGECLNEVYGVYDRVEDIDFDSLPDQFVIKAAHGSHMLYIVKDKSAFDWEHAKIMMKTWLNQDIYWSGREWVYKDMPKRLIIEKYLEDEAGELKDYKFFCFHGKPFYMQYDTGRYKEHYRNYYSIDKELLHFYDKEKLPSISEIPFPVDDAAYNKMLQICCDLSSPFQQVRVDLYAVHDKVYFGEMTFYDGGGGTAFFPAEWDYVFSEKWHVTRQEGRRN